MGLSKMLKDFIKYGSSVLGADLILSFTSAFISARILGPEKYGLWIALFLVLQYGAYLHLGIGNALVKEVSFYLGRNDLQHSEKIKNIAFGAISIVSIVAAIVVFVFSFVFAYKYEKNTLLALRIIAVLLVFQQIYEYFRRYFIAINNFKAVSELRIFFALLTGFLTIIFVIKFNFIGMPLALTFSYILILMYMAKRYNVSIRPEINIEKSIFLFRIGFPIMAASILYVLFVTIERVLILRYFGKANLGYYSLACMIQGFFGLLLFTLGDIVFVTLSKRYGSTNSTTELGELVCGSTIWLAYVLSTFSGIIYVFLPSLVKIALPQYLPGINFARIALLGIIFLYWSAISGEFLFAINKQVHYFFFLLSALILKITMAYIFIVKQMGINGIIIGNILVYFLFSNFIMIYSFLHFKKCFLELIKYLTQIYLPLLYMLLILYILSLIMRNPLLVTLDEINRISISFLFLILLLLPLIYSFKVFIFRKRNYDLNID